MYRSLLLAAALATPLAAFANIDRSITPVYIEGGQYTATLQARSQAWRLTPLDGGDVAIQPGAMCPHTALPVKGLWLIGRDAEGRPELVAVSATLLPAGHSGRIALRSCDDASLRDASQPAYGVPAQVLAMLVEQSGAVLVDD
jgi:hypothetical protein